LFFGGNDNLKEMRSWIMQQHKTITLLHKKNTLEAFHLDKPTFYLFLVIHPPKWLHSKNLCPEYILTSINSTDCKQCMQFELIGCECSTQGP